MMGIVQPGEAVGSGSVGDRCCGCGVGSNAGHDGGSVRRDTARGSTQPSWKCWSRSPKKGQTPCYGSVGMAANHAADRAVVAVAMRAPTMTSPGSAVVAPPSWRAASVALCHRRRTAQTPSQSATMMLGRAALKRTTTTGHGATAGQSWIDPRCWPAAVTVARPPPQGPRRHPILGTASRDEGYRLRRPLHPPPRHRPQRTLPT
mmetsp:Transcript_9979/g.19017  ORF Transcript_9979/g.19017 Transcript_9979/m.19017 type:complete len:204 (-) Transcript_9979:1452-2063(-)